LVQSSEKTPSVLFLKNYLPMEWVDRLASDIWSPSFTSLARSRGDDSRGTQRTVDLGVWLQRGRRTFHQTPATQTKRGKQFIHDHSKVWESIRWVMQTIDRKYIQEINQSRHKAEFGGVFSFAVVNIDNTTNSHRDVKDFKWCCVIPLGHFTGGGLYLPYLGIELAAKPTDIILFLSHELWHQAKEVLSGQRGSIVLTNHTTVVNDR
jgi:hypothetical protein